MALRRTGIAYDSVPASLRDTAVEPGDFGYAAASATYLRGGSPGLVLRPATEQEVAEAVVFASAQPVPLGIRSGGHGISGRSTNDGGIVIDVGALNGVEVVDAATRRVRIGPGARWTDVAAILGEHGWALSSGDYGGVGVGGLATAGGVGWLVREHGLTIDHMVAARIALADGSIVLADAEHEPELFWAIRGAGANFGVVTSFEFEVDEVGDIGFATLFVDASDWPAFLAAWGAAIQEAPRDVTSFVLIGPARRGQPAIAQVMVAVDSDDVEIVRERLQPFVELTTVLGGDARITTYAALMANVSPEPHAAVGEPVTRSALARRMTPQLAERLAHLQDSGLISLVSLRSLGGAVADVPVNATAFSARDAEISITVFGMDRASLDAAWDELAEHFNGVYLSFETDQRPERVAEAFEPATLARLRELKRRLDPANVLRDNFDVMAGLGADAATEADAAAPVR